MTREEILRNAEALANTLTDEAVRGLIQHAYIKGAKDNAVEDNIVNVRMITDSKTGEKYPFVSYKDQLQKPAERSEKHIADIFEKVGLAKIAREQGNDELTNALQDAMLELSKVESAKLSAEDKQLVLKDISARVPYKVKFQNENIPTPNVLTLDMTYLRMFEIREGVIFKPYLRPRSSMTEAEKDEEFKMCSLNCSEWEMADFFNKHHLDYHGLIEKGLAIEAPDGMY